MAVGLLRLTMLAWPLSASAVALPSAIGPPNPAAGPLRPAALEGALLLAGPAIRPLVRPSHRLLRGDQDDLDETVATALPQWGRAA